MYCGSCGEERIATNLRCAVCKDALTRRSLEELQQALAVARALLLDAPKWSRDEVGLRAYEYLKRRYQEQERALEAALRGEDLREPPPPVALSIAPAPAEPIIDALPLPEAAPMPPPSPPPPEASLAAALHEGVADAIEVPLPPSRAQAAVESVSTWNRLWKPFLYESVGWFVGAFLILAGTFYFVAESWAGMTSSTRSLVVFGITAGYSAGFALWAAFLRRRESLQSAGRVLGLIAAAIAPLAAIPLSIGETPSALATAGGVLWAIAVAFIARPTAEAFDPASSRPVRVLLSWATVVMTAAPWLAQLGSGALWLNLVSIALFAWVARTRVERTAEQLLFVVLAPAFLVALAGIRLHLALGEVSALPHAGTYAPFVSALLAAALPLHQRRDGRSADALTVCAVAIQAACLGFAVPGEWPSLFASSALLAWTTWSLARGEVGRVRWLYGTYAAGYFAYQTAGQLVPGAVRVLFEKVTAAFGYGAGALPWNFNALYALPYVVGGGLLAWAWRRREDERGRAVHELLLRATAAAALVTAVMALGSDARPAIWGLPVLVVGCVALGLALNRPYLTISGALCATLLPLVVMEAYDWPTAALVAAVLACGFAAARVLVADRPNHARGAAIVVLAALSQLLAWGGQGAWTSALAALLSGLAVVALWWSDRRPGTLTLAAASTGSAAPLALLAFAPTYAPLSAAAVALALGLLSLREQTRVLWVLSAIVAVLASAWALPVFVREPAARGLTYALAAGVTLLASRRAPPLGALAALLLTAALSVTWSFLEPSRALALVAAAAAVNSAVVARWGNSWFTRTFAALLLLSGLVDVFFTSGADHPLLWVALTALLSARALHPTFSVLVAGGLLCADLLDASPWLLTAIAVALTALAQREARWARRLLLGTEEARVPLALVALAVSALAIRFGLGRPDPAQLWLLLALAPLPLLWVRATELPGFAVAGPLLVALFDVNDPSRWTGWAAAAYSVVTARALWHLPALRRWVIGATSARFFQYHLLGVAIVAGGAALELSRREPALVLALAAALVLAAGGPLWARLAVAAQVAVAVEGAVPFVGPLAILVGLAVHNFPKGAGHALAAEVTPGDTRGAGLVALFGAGWLFRDDDWAALFPLLQLPVILAAPLLVGTRWLLVLAAPFAAAASFTFDSSEPWTWAAALLALLAGLQAALRHPRVHDSLLGAAGKLTPAFEGAASDPLWIGGALSVAAVGLGHAWASGRTDPSVPVLLALSSLALLVTQRSWQAAIAGVLAASTFAWAAGPEWASASMALVAVGLTALGALGGDRLSSSRGLFHVGWAMALVSLGLLPDPHQPSMTITFVLIGAVAWLSVVRHRALEPLAWLATLGLTHAVMVQAAIVYSTGRGEEFILPYLGAISALVASVALLSASERFRTRVGLGLSVVALLELGLGLVFIDGPAAREALLASIGLAVLCASALRHAVRAKDVSAAFIAQLSLVWLYLVARLLWASEGNLGQADALVALVAGVIFSGLKGVAARTEGMEVFAWPARLAAFVFPLLGLLVAPWHAPVVTALILIGHAMHYSGMALREADRKVASLLATAAFNAALVVAWLGTGAGEPEYYVLPLGISLLLVLRIFQGDLEETTFARLRGIAVTVVYAAAAWRPLMFEHGGSMLLCVLVCVLGVAAGVALRIRSYVYLGSAFLVTTVVANLVRYGARDHRLAAVFLFALGLTVVGFMVLFTAYRAELIRRYERLQALVKSWE